MKTNIFLTISLLILITATAGCIDKSSEFACNEPYIQIGSDCCLDANDNSICDSDETAEETSEIPEEQPIENETEEVPEEETTESLGEWCTETDHNELTDPIMFINREFLMSADHYFMNKYSLRIDSVLAGSDVLTAYGLWTPAVDYEYQSYNITNLKVDAKVQGKEREVDFGTVFEKDVMKAGTFYEGMSKDEDIYIMLKLEDVQEGDQLQFRINYDIGKSHYTICEERDKVSIIEQEPGIELHLVEKTQFEKKGKFFYEAEYVFGSATSTASHNIFEQSGELAGEAGAYIFYQKDTIEKTVGAHTYDLETEKIEPVCMDPNNCAFKLTFNRGNCTDVMQNLCTHDSYLAFTVYDLTTEEFADYMVKLDKNDELENICRDPCT